jgi:hypothetical protein
MFIAHRKRRWNEPYPRGVIGPREFFEDADCTVPCARDKYAGSLCYFNGRRLISAPDAYPEDVLYIFAIYAA